VGNVLDLDDEGPRLGEIAMTQENEFIAVLRAARDQAVHQRRSVIKALSGPYERGETERMRELLPGISHTISLIDAAIQDEKRIAAGEPIPATIGTVSVPGLPGLDDT